ncbi:hypothetical protein M758_12G148300 [Ceratodon purpureus]|nr:hypothetical protein M758_12G148300 [Ceratodon purpureus]
MSSINFYRTKSFPPANVTDCFTDCSTDCPVTLNEIFDPIPNFHIARDGNREELPNQRVSLCLYSGVQDWKGLEKALAEDGMEVKAKDDIVYVSGYATRNDYNYNKEIREKVARYRRVSKSFSM